MTIPAGNDSDETGAFAGRAVATTSDATGIDPFLTAAAAGPDGTPRRTFKSMILDYSAHAAMIVGLIGFAWTVSDHVVARQTAAQIEAPVPVTKVADVAKPDEATELRRANQQMADDIKALRANIDTLRTSIKHDRTPEQVRALAESLEGVKTGLTSTKTETNTAIAQLSGKIEKLQHDPNSKIQQLVDRLGKMEHQPLDTPTTGSIGAGALTTSQAAKLPPVPPSKPASVKLASIEDGHKAAMDDTIGKPPILAGWVVRDVYDGVAIVQGKHGSIEVVPGVSIPGAGTVKSIDRHGAGWTVTTTKGQMAYAAPAHEYRRGVNRDFGGGRDFYPDDRYDF